MLSDSQIAEMNIDAAFGQFVFKQDKETRLAVVAAICPELVSPAARQNILDNYQVQVAFFKLERRQKTDERRTSKEGYDSEDDLEADFWSRFLESTRQLVVTAVRAASVRAEEPAAKRARTDEPAAGGSKD